VASRSGGREVPLFGLFVLVSLAIALYCTYVAVAYIANYGGFKTSDYFAAMKGLVLIAFVLTLAFVIRSYLRRVGRTR